MSPELISIAALVVAFALATVLSVNMGVLAFAAAFLVGRLAGGMSDDDIFAGFPGDLFVVLVGVTYLFAIARANGTTDWLVDRSVRLVGGRVAVIPWVMFAIGALLTAIGAVSPAACAIVAPIALNLAHRYRIRPLLMGAMVVHGTQAGAFSPISVYGTIVNGVVDKNDLPGGPLTLFLGSLVVNFLIAAVVYVLFGGLKLLREERSARTARGGAKSRALAGAGARGGAGTAAAGAGGTADTARGAGAGAVPGGPSPSAGAAGVGGESAADGATGPAGGVVAASAGRTDGSAATKTRGETSSSPGAAGVGDPSAAADATGTADTARGADAGAVPGGSSPSAGAAGVGGEPAAGSATGPASGGTSAAAPAAAEAEGDAAPERLDRDRALTLAGLVALVVGALAFDLDVGLMSLTIAVLLSFVSPATCRKAPSEVAWPTVLLVCGVLTYVAVLESMGTIDYAGHAVAGIGIPLLAALLLCYIGAIVSAFASSTALMGALIPLAVPFLQDGSVGAVGMVTALAVAATVVDVSPFSTNGAIVLANTRSEERDAVYRQLLIYGGVIAAIVPFLTWLAFVLPDTL